MFYLRGLATDQLSGVLVVVLTEIFFDVLVAHRTFQLADHGLVYAPGSSIVGS